MASWLRAGLVVGAALLGSVAAQAKPPAYTFANLSFTTSLHGVPEGERREACLDKDCAQTSGVIVAEGETKGDGARVSIEIREHKRRGGIAKVELAELSKGLLGGAPNGKEVRAISGAIGTTQALEHWSVWDGCSREISGRVFIALPDKIIEVEARAPLSVGREGDDPAIVRMNKILRGVRVRRMGDVSLDPAKDAMGTREMDIALSSTPCSP